MFFFFNVAQNSSITPENVYGKLISMALVQDCSISSALAMEILQSCIKPSIYNLLVISQYWSHGIYIYLDTTGSIGGRRGINYGNTSFCRQIDIRFTGQFFVMILSLQWRHIKRNGVSNHRRLDGLLNRFSGVDQRKHQSSVSLVVMKRIHRWPVDSPHKGPVTRKMFPFDDVIM